jgi:hypothetical protein
VVVAEAEQEGPRNAEGQSEERQAPAAEGQSNREATKIVPLSQPAPEADRQEDVGDVAVSQLTSRRESGAADRLDGPPRGLVVHDSLIKNGWAVKNVHPATRTLVIADSQFRHIREVPESWEIHVFPGANLSHANAIVNRLGSRKGSLQTVVTHVGINNRGCNWENSAYVDINKLMCSLEKMATKAVFCGVSIPEGLTPKEKDLLEKINEQAQKRMGGDELRCTGAQRSG